MLYEVGKQAQLTVIQAKVDVANAEVSEIQAENARQPRPGATGTDRRGYV